MMRLSAAYAQTPDGQETTVERELDVTEGFLADFELASLKEPPSREQPVRTTSHWW